MCEEYPEYEPEPLLSYRERVADGESLTLDDLTVQMTDAQGEEIDRLSITKLRIVRDGDDLIIEVRGVNCVGTRKHYIPQSSLWHDLFSRYPTVCTQDQRTLRIAAGGLAVGLLGFGATIGFGVYGPYWAAWTALATGLAGMLSMLVTIVRDGGPRC